LKIKLLKEDATSAANILSCLQEDQGGLKPNPQWLATVTQLESTKNNFATSEVKQLRRFSQ
jgi:hypothetical protein